MRKISTIIKIHKYLITRRAIYLKERRLLFCCSIWSYWTGITAHKDITLGEQWWRSGKNVQLPPMFPVSKDKTTYKLCCSRRHNGWLVSRLHSNEFKSSKLEPWRKTLYSSQRDPLLQLISFDITWLSVSQTIFFSPWMECQSIIGLPPSITFASTPFVHLGWERHCESEVFCPRTQHRPSEINEIKKIEFSWGHISPPILTGPFFKDMHQFEDLIFITIH